MRNGHLHRAIISFLVVLLAAEQSQATVRVALLQSDAKTTGNVVALLETRLSGGGKVALVERQQVEKVLAEQQLQAVLGADAVKARAAMGKLLQADLLVFISLPPAPTPARGKPGPQQRAELPQTQEPYLDVVISE